MIRKKSKPLKWGLLLVLALGSITVQAADRAACILKVHADFSEAQRQLQRELRSLIAAKWAHMDEVATLNMDFQLKLIRQKEQRFRFVARKYPERLATVNGVLGLINLTGNWPSQDQSALLADDAGYWVLQKGIDDIQKRTKSHPDWPALLEFFQTSLTSEQAFQKAQKRLEAAVGRADEHISACP